MDRVKQMVLLAEAAYHDNYHFEGYKATLISAEGSQAWLLQNDTEQIIAFRGTEMNDIRDLLADIMMLPIPSSSGKGYTQHGYECAVNHIWKLIKPWINPSKKLYLTGHSLGGAMALVAAGRLARCTPVVYTFGCPRATTRGNSVVAALDHKRYVNASDVVPKLPWFPYWHHGELHYISREKEVKGTQPWTDFFKPGLLKHPIGDYVTALT
jgi:triacylglycerol lipase